MPGGCTEEGKMQQAEEGPLSLTGAHPPHSRAQLFPCPLCVSALEAAGASPCHNGDGPERHHDRKACEAMHCGKKKGC